MNISKNDIAIWKRAENKILILNRETGRWFVGVDEDNAIENYINDSITFTDIKDHAIIKQLSEQNILFTDKNNSIIEQPYNDQLGLLILDTTNKCNLACKYCFVSATEKGVIMSLNTASKALELTLNSSKCANTLTIEFSGGEPLLNFSMIKQFVPIATEIAKRQGKNLAFTIQTNGTLLNKEIMNFLLKYKINVGISIDGTKEFHDQNRVFADGSGSLKTITQNINTFMKLGGHVSILAVIADVDQYDSVIRYAVENNISSIRTNLVTKVGRAEEKSKFNLEYINLANKFIDVADDMLSGKIKVHDVTLSHFLWNLIQIQPHMCFRVPCGSGKNQISITATGDIYTCQEWRNIHDTPIGNVDTCADLDDLLSHNKRAMELSNRSVKNADCCQKCNWKTFCGICPREIYSENHNTLGKIAHCDFQNRIFEQLAWKFYDHSKEIQEYLLT